MKELKKLFSKPAEVEPVKMPLFKLCFEPLGLFVDNFKQLFLLIAFYGLLATAVSFAFGFPYACFSPSSLGQKLYCSSSNALYAAYLVIKILLFAKFFERVYALNLKTLSLKLKELVSFGRKELKISALLSVCILLNLLPLVSLAVLAARVPNPDWVVETFFFGVVSTGFFVPFIIMRFYGVFGLAAENKPLVSLAEIWRLTAGNGLKILLGLFVILIFTSFLLGGFNSNVRAISAANGFYTSFVSELLYNVILFTLFALFVNHCFMQHKFIFGEKKHG